jgi:hypothetical protein
MTDKSTEKVHTVNDESVDVPLTEKALDAQPGTWDGVESTEAEIDPELQGEVETTDGVRHKGVMPASAAVDGPDTSKATHGYVAEINAVIDPWNPARTKHNGHEIIPVVVKRVGSGSKGYRPEFGFGIYNLDGTVVETAVATAKSKSAKSKDA